MENKKMDYINCEKCKNESFIVDTELSELEFPVQPIMFEIAGITKLKYKRVFFCCDKCGWKFPSEIKEIGDSVTIKFTLTPKK